MSKLGLSSIIFWTCSIIPLEGTTYTIFLSLLSYASCKALYDLPVPVAGTIPTTFSPAANDAFTFL